MHNISLLILATKKEVEIVTNYVLRIAQTVLKLVVFIIETIILFS